MLKLLESSKEQADFNEVQSLEDEPPHGSQSTDLNSAEDIHPSNSGSLAEGQATGSGATDSSSQPDASFLDRRINPIILPISSPALASRSPIQRQATPSTSARDVIRGWGKEAMERFMYVGLDLAPCLRGYAVL
ncbi:hypothetical protein I312_100812 [Cryptococcus bacillisporus CA1280]|uniref:uncharacterized protein n=1 Tax=Cryptococcus bacillisporus CA1280 TaxID=1296109 RepID=UPI003369318C